MNINDLVIETAKHTRLISFSFLIVFSFIITNVNKDATRSINTALKQAEFLYSLKSGLIFPEYIEPSRIDIAPGKNSPLYYWDGKNNDIEADYVPGKDYLLFFKNNEKEHKVIFPNMYFDTRLYGDVRITSRFKEDYTDYIQFDNNSDRLNDIISEWNRLLDIRVFNVEWVLNDPTIQHISHNRHRNFSTEKDDETGVSFNIDKVTIYRVDRPYPADAQIYVSSAGNNLNLADIKGGVAGYSTAKYVYQGRLRIDGLPEGVTFSLPVSLFSPPNVNGLSQFIEYNKSISPPQGLTIDKFSHSFPELFNLTKDVNSLNKDQLILYLKNKKGANQVDLDVFGIKIKTDDYVVITATILLLLSIYYRAHLRNYLQLISSHEVDDIALLYPWVATYKDRLSGFIFYSTSIIIPLISIFLLIYLSIQYFLLGVPGKFDAIGYFLDSYIFVLVSGLFIFQLNYIYKYCKELRSLIIYMN